MNITFCQKVFLERKVKQLNFAQIAIPIFIEYSKKHITNPYDENEALDIWDRWLTSVSIIVSTLIIGLVVYFW